MTVLTKIHDSMLTHPVKWAGFAAGTGFAIGLIGRIAQTRYRWRHEPPLVILESPR